MAKGSVGRSITPMSVALFNANFDKGVEIAKATGAKDVWPN
jgi:hypothetical protein